MNRNKIIATVLAVVAIMLVGLAACSSGGHKETTRAGCKAAVLEYIHTHEDEIASGKKTHILPECKGLSASVRFELFQEVIATYFGGN